MGWLGTAFLHAAIIVVMVLVGADSLDSDSGGGHTWSLLRNGLLMFTIVIITVHLQLAIVIDQWIWLHHLAIWGSIGKPAPASQANQPCCIILLVVLLLGAVCLQQQEITPYGCCTGTQTSSGASVIIGHSGPSAHKHCIVTPLL